MNIAIKVLGPILILGIIITLSIAVSISELEQINYTNHDLSCIDPFSLSDEPYIIENKKQLDNLTNTECRKEINFNESILLGKKTQVGGCGVSTRQILYKSNSKIVYEIDSKGEGMCDALFANMNWITISNKYSNKNIEISSLN